MQISPAMRAERVARDLDELRDRPLGGVGVLDDPAEPHCWILFVRPSKGVLRDGVFIFRVMFDDAYPARVPDVSAYSGLKMEEYFELARASWTPTHTMRGYCSDLRRALENATLVDAEQLVRDSRVVFERDFDGAVFIASDEVEGLAGSVKQAKADSRAWLTASQLFSLSGSEIGLSTSGIGLSTSAIDIDE